MGRTFNNNRFICSVDISHFVAGKFEVASFVKSSITHAKLTVVSLCVLECTTKYRVSRNSLDKGRNIGLMVGARQTYVSIGA